MSGKGNGLSPLPMSPKERRDLPAGDPEVEAATSCPSRRAHWRSRVAGRTRACGPARRAPARCCRVRDLVDDADADAEAREPEREDEAGGTGAGDEDFGIRGLRHRSSRKHESQEYLRPSKHTAGYRRIRREVCRRLSMMISIRPLDRGLLCEWSSSLDLSDSSDSTNQRPSVGV